MSAQRRQRETWEHKTRADSCMEMSCSVRSGKCQAAVLPCTSESSGTLDMCVKREKDDGSQQ